MVCKDRFRENEILGEQISIPHIDVALHNLFPSLKCLKPQKLTEEWNLVEDHLLHSLLNVRLLGYYLGLLLLFRC